MLLEKEFSIYLPYSNESLNNIRLMFLRRKSPNILKHIHYLKILKFLFLL